MRTSLTSSFGQSRAQTLLRVTLLLSSTLFVLCLHTETMARGQLLNDCKDRPSRDNVQVQKLTSNVQLVADQLRKFVDNCVKTKDGIRFRKRHSTSTSVDLASDDSEWRRPRWSVLPPLAMWLDTARKRTPPLDLSGSMARRASSDGQTSPPSPEGSLERTSLRVLVNKFLDNLPRPTLNE